MLYAIIRALGSLPSVAPFGYAQGRLYRPRWRWYYTHSCCCFKALNPNEASFTDPEVSQTRKIYVNLELKDDGDPNLYSYRRIMITIKP